MKNAGKEEERPKNAKEREYPLKNKMRVLLALHVILVGCMAYFWITFPKKVESKIVVQQEFRATKIPSFYLYSDVRLRTISGSGSGVAISTKLAITNNHVVTTLGKGGTLWVDWEDEAGQHSNVATVMALDSARDLALISLAADAVFNHHVSISETVMSWGDPIIVVGSPAGLYPVPTTGTFVKRAVANGMDLLQAEVFPGNSGGPVFDASTGQLIGLTSRLCAFSNVPAGNGATMPLLATYVFLAVPSAWILDFLHENNIVLRHP